MGEGGWMSHTSRWPGEVSSMAEERRASSICSVLTAHLTLQRLWPTEQTTSFSDSHFTQDPFSPGSLKNDSNQSTLVYPLSSFTHPNRADGSYSHRGGACREWSQGGFAQSLLWRCSDVPLRSTAGGCASPGQSRTFNAALSSLAWSTCFGSPTLPQAL